MQIWILSCFLSLLCSVSGILSPHLLWPDWPTSPSPWTTSAVACQTAALWPTSPTATWWICRGRPLQVHPLPLLLPRPQRGGSPRASRVRPRARPQAQPQARPQAPLRAQGASSAPSPVWWRVLRWPRMSLPLRTPNLQQQPLKEPRQAAVSHPNLPYASPRSCWSSMISTQTGEWKLCVSVCVGLGSWPQKGVFFAFGCMFSECCCLCHHLNSSFAFVPFVSKQFNR